MLPDPDVSMLSNSAVIFCVGGTTRAISTWMASTIKSILIVEDEPSLRRIVASAVKSLGFDAVQAEDGLDALDILRRIRPAAIVLDLQMPRVNGWQFLDCYQCLTRAPVPIVVTSASLTPEIRLNLRQLGVEHCFEKPCDLDELLECIESVVMTVRVDSGRRLAQRARWNHLKELEAAVKHRLDTSHVLLIRAEDALGWSQAAIAAYYAERGVVLAPPPPPTSPAS